MNRTARIVVACLAACWFGRAAVAEDDDPAAFVRVLPDSDGRLLAWALGDKEFGTVQTARVLLSKGPGSDKPALGFAHSGYSAEDPDGKNAILTFSVELVNVPATAEDKAALELKGAKYDEDLAVENPSFTFVDISLTADLDEEKRLRTEQHLPRMIGDASARQPFSIRWKGVRGETLYKWLTDPTGGLKVVFTDSKGAEASVPVVWTLYRTYSIDPVRLAAWWTSNVGMRVTYAWKGGVEVIAQSLIASGALLVDGAPATLEDSEPEFKLLCEKIGSASEKLPKGVLKIAKPKFLGLASKGRLRTYAVVGGADALPAFSPGRKLLDFPAQVKDLTGESVGLDALKNDTE